MGLGFRVWGWAPVSRFSHACFVHPWSGFVLVLLTDHTVHASLLAVAMRLRRRAMCLELSFSLLWYFGTTKICWPESSERM